MLAAAIVDGRLEMFLTNSLQALDSGRLLIAQFLEPKTVGPRVMNRIEVVFEEVVANIIRHGFHPHSDQLLLVAAETGPADVEFMFEDEGIPFDPLSIPLHEGPRSLETVELGGLGVPLIRKLSSGARYERIAPSAATRRLGQRVFAPVNRLTLRISK